MAITWYSFFRLLHVLSAIFLMGPHFLLVLMIRHMRKQPESARAVYPLLETAGRFPGVGGPMMLVTGLLMIGFGSGWSAFRELWISAAVALFVFGVIWMKVGIEPPFKAMTAAIQNVPINPDEFQGLSSRVIRAISVESVWMVVVALLMILKPTL